MADDTPHKLAGHPLPLKAVDRTLTAGSETAAWWEIWNADGKRVARLAVLRDRPASNHSSHWDRTGQHGAGCDACRMHHAWADRARDLVDRVEALLGERDA